MRIINDKEEKTIICNNCKTNLAYDFSDILMTSNEGLFIRCQNCNEKILLSDEESYFVNTIDNLKFPQHYYNFNGVKINEEEINAYVKECYNNLKDAPIGHHAVIATGDSIVFVIKYEDEYSIVVAKNYYEANLYIENEGD